MLYLTLPPPQQKTKKYHLSHIFKVGMLIFSNMYADTLDIAQLYNIAILNVNSVKGFICLQIYYY